MPTSDQHGQRVKQAHFWLNQVQKPSECFNVAVTEYFYAALHMLEAAVYDFPELADGAEHFVSHKQRSDFLQGFVRHPGNPLRAVGPQYESLREFSERGRYLSPARMSVFQPLRPSDVPKAKQLHDTVKASLEALYQKRGKPVPWASTPPAVPAAASPTP